MRPLWIWWCSPSRFPAGQERHWALMRQLEVKTAQVRMSARLVAGMPVFMVGFLSLASSDFRAGVFTPSGLGSLAVALFLNMFAWSIIRKIMRVDV